jgi:DMSO/TMAO reductase YedYZ molybdopterin-dependent catalytic subunit
MGWIAGAAAAAAAALALLVMRAALGGPSLPEVVQDAIILATPGPLFSFMLDQLRFAGRPLLFAAILVGMFVVGGAIGRAYAARPRSDQAAFRLAALLFVLIGLVGFPLLGAGVLGTGRPADVPLWITTAVAIAVYVGALHLLLRPAWAEPAGLDRGRRRLLGQAAAGASLAGLALIGWRAFALSGGVAPAPTPQPAAAGGAAPATAAGHAATEHPTPDITPIDTFYVVSKNFADPRVAAAGWKLRLDGLVEAPYELTLDELKALPAVEQPATLCCISNEVGGDLVGNAHWKGVRLADLLQKAGVKAGAVDVVFHCRDDYKDSIAIDRATMPGTLVVYEMDGAPLTDKHGFPARVIVPGIFGMKNAKWLQRIEVVDLDFKGFWQQQGWSDPAPYLTMSRIDSPTPGGRVAAGPGVVHGIAFAGDRGISTVEVSTDAGVGWREAKLLPATGPYSWVRWSFEWDAPAGARPTLQVRAYDGGGEPQIARPASPFPDGATGYHSIQIRVAEA